MEKIEFKLINLNKMIVSLKKATTRLAKVTDSEDIEYFQDSVAARFKILIESTWKNIKLHLENEKFADVPASPKGVITFAKEANLLTQEEHDQFIKYLTLRNLASHMYDQPQYLLVIQAAPGAVVLIQTIIDRISPVNATKIY
jgi:uncharacterized protein YutE (UPF0331/DUF86 family)